MCEPCGRERQLRDAIMKALSEGKKLIFVFAPTGYGKTRVSPYLLHAAREKGLASRLIHVVPTRALVKEIYEEKFKGPAKECGIHAAYQSLDRLCEGIKSPYFLAELVVTTLESFILNAFKLPPAEFTKVVKRSARESAKVVKYSTEGHYYPSVLALLSSIVVFDEAHLYISEAEGKPVTLVVAAARALLEMNVPVIILTATMPVVQFEYVWKALKVRMDDVKVLYLCPAPGSCKQAEKMKEEGYDVEEIQDDPQRFNKIEWRTSVVSYKAALDIAKKKCQNELVLWVSNTVGGAVRAFDQLDGCERVLIHGKLSELDKEAAIKKMEELKGELGEERGDNRSSPCTSEKSMKEREEELDKKAARERKGIIVASPIAEVGLDIDATTLISEATSIESLVQRAGRLYRKRSEGRAEVIVIEPEEEKEEKKGVRESAESEEEKMKRAIDMVIQEIENRLEQGPAAIDWRSPAALGGRISYVELMESLTEKRREDYSEDHSKRGGRGKGKERREGEKREEDYSLSTSYAELFKGIVMFDSRPRQVLEALSSVPGAREDHGALLHSLSLVKVKVGEKERENTIDCPFLPRLRIDYVIISTTDLKRDWVKWEMDRKEVEIEAIVRYSGTEKKETFYSRALANVLLFGGEKGRSMNIHDIRKIMDELTKRAEEKLEQEGRKGVRPTIIDYFLVAREGAYSPGRGLGVDEAPRE
ncbi:MAG: DEAD/DEAH box helicase [Acidilobaceae archaeon]|nr:DEAD/DEAH box helicase [Acidilobaceae archaeon]MDW7973664.1 DEAD/DEAH box helicase [Sulfolobales archaeon]